MDIDMYIEATGLHALLPYLMASTKIMDVKPGVPEV